MPTTPIPPIDRAPTRPVGRDSGAPLAPAARHRKSRGQSLAEFALTLPMALLMVLFGLDFGRVFLGWVALNNAAREAANYAAMNPTAWSLPFNTAVQDEYDRLVETEASNINCDLESPVSWPSFADGTSIGAPASVILTCDFELLTPFIGVLMGNPIEVTASSAFPVRSGLIEGVPVESIIPSATPSPSPSISDAPTPTPSATPAVSLEPGATPSPTPTPTPTPSPTPTPTPTPTSCTVVSLINLQTNKAAGTWRDAGFTGSVIFSPLVPPHYRIAWQSLTVGSSVSCTSGITVRSSAP